MEARYQIIYRIICAWNMTFYMRIRDLSKKEVEMLQNTTGFPFSNPYERNDRKIEIIKKNDIDYRYLVYTKTIYLSQFIERYVSPYLHHKNINETMVRIKKCITQNKSDQLIYQYSLN